MDPFAPAPYCSTFAPQAPGIPPSSVASQASANPGHITSIPGIPQSRSVPDLAAATQADHDAGETRVRLLAGFTATFPLTFDNGRQENVSALTLIGCNLAGYDGEMIPRLIFVHDTSRSVSKIHFPILVSSESLGMTDGNPTKDSAISPAVGAKTRLTGGISASAETSARVQFGNRSFVVAKA